MDPSVIESLKILGLPPDATLKEIKQAYKDLVTVWHPDRFANNPRLHEKASEKLKELNVAYNNIISFYQDMIFTERKATFQEAPQQPPPEQTPFYPSDKPPKSFRLTRYMRLMIVIFIAGAIYLIWGQNLWIEIKSAEPIPQSSAPSMSPVITSPQISDETKIEVKQTDHVPVAADQIKQQDMEQTKPAKEIKQTASAQITDDKIKKQEPERNKPSREAKIKKVAVVQSSIKISERPDIAWLTDDEQSSIKSACSEAKTEGAASYSTCLKNQLAKLAQGERKPDLSRLTYEEKSSIESVCSSAKFKDGPASYHRCLKNQLATMAQGERRPDLSRLTYEEKSSIESACSGAKMEGPASYNRCLSNHLATLTKGEKRPDLSYLTLEEKSSIASSCGVAKMEGPASYNKCLTNHLKLYSR